MDLSVEVMVPILLAITEHDDGVTETLATQNLTDVGAPRSFTVKDNTSNADITPLRSLMEIESSKIQLNGLLSSMHLQFLYDGDHRAKDKGLDDFLKEQEQYRSTVLKNLKLNKKKADVLYRFLE